MSDQAKSYYPLDDEMLVAYLDGQLGPDVKTAIEKEAAENPDLAAQIAAALLNEEALRTQADRLLTQAPMERLQAQLDEALDAYKATAPEDDPDFKPEADHWPSRRAFLATAAMVPLAFLAGGVSLNGLNIWEDGSKINWREEVARYHALYGPDTLKNLEDTDPEKVAATLSNQIGTSIAVPSLTHEGWSFKRGQLLDFQGNWLVQLAYSGPNDIPLALCMTPSSGTAQNKTVAFETRHDMPVFFWSEQVLDFMVIAKIEKEALERLLPNLQSA